MMKTKLLRLIHDRQYKFSRKREKKKGEKKCHFILYAGKTGKFFRDGVEDRSSPESYDVDLQNDVWKKSSRLVNIRSMETGDGFDDISLSSQKT